MSTLQHVIYTYDLPVVPIQEVTGEHLLLTSVPPANVPLCVRLSACLVVLLRSLVASDRSLQLFVDAKQSTLMYRLDENNDDAALRAWFVDTVAQQYVSVAVLYEALMLCSADRAGLSYEQRMRATQLAAAVRDNRLSLLI